MANQEIISVAASTDDAHVSFDDTAYAEAEIETKVWSNTDQALRFIGGFRFLSVDILPGSTIDAATVEIVQSKDDTSYDTRADTVIYCEDADNAVTFSSGDNPADRTKTTASATWVEGTEITQGSLATTSDFTTAVQEVIDRGSWASGNALVVLIEGANAVAGNLSPASYDHTTLDPPEITIDWHKDATITCVEGGATAAGEAAVVSTEVFSDNFTHAYYGGAGTGNGLSLASHARQSPDDYDFRVLVKAGADWDTLGYRTLVEKRTDATSDREYRWRIDTAGTMALSWSLNGSSWSHEFSNNLQSNSVPTDQFVWLRVTRERSSGDVEWYYSTDIDQASWTSLGSGTSTAGGATAGAATLNVMMQANQGVSFTSDFAALEIYSGINGSLVERVRASDASSDSDTSFTSSVSGATVTVHRSGSPDLEWNASSNDVTVVEGTATASGEVPSVSTTANASVAAVEGGATASGEVPTVTAVRNVSVAGVEATATAAGEIPTVTTDSTQSATVSAVEASATASGDAPTVTAVQNVSITAVEAVATAAGEIPAVTTAIHATVTAVEATATAAGEVATVTTTSNVSVAAVEALSTATAEVPTVSAQRVVSIVAVEGTATASGSIPTVRTAVLSEGIRVALTNERVRAVLATELVLGTLETEQHRILLR
jgi:hypothetical protein